MTKRKPKAKPRPVKAKPAQVKVKAKAKAVRARVPPVPVLDDTDGTPAELADDAPPDEEEPVVEPTPIQRARVVSEIRIRLRGEYGEPLNVDAAGDEVPIVMAASERGPTLQDPTHGVFVAERMDGEGEWIYRRVGVERMG